MDPAMPVKHTGFKFLKKKNERKEKRLKIEAGMAKQSKKKGSEAKKKGLNINRHKPRLGEVDTSLSHPTWLSVNLLHYTILVKL